MAASVKRKNKPALLSSLVGCGSAVNGVCTVAHEEAVISVSDDRTLRVWARRTDVQYWPTICHTYQCAASALAYDRESRRLFVGLGSGSIHEYVLSEDINRMEPKRNYNAHTGRVTALKFNIENNWLLSVSRDKSFEWHCTSTGRPRGNFKTQSWCTAVELDTSTKHAFVADYSGVITVLKLDPNNFQEVTTLRGHQSSVRTLCWDQEKRLLFSGGFDGIVVIWDIGSRQGTAYELTGHRGCVKSLAYSSTTHKLLSTAEDARIGLWDINTERQETAEWGEGGQCEKCGTPFFWNVKMMWERKTIGGRQHHCRKCGRVVCAKCSESQSTFPPMGFEVPVRMCSDCHSSITTEQRSPMAEFMEMRPVVVAMYLDEEKKLMITADTDNKIGVWDIKSLLAST
ncbi:WD repeat and FYVE domain-containing protein 2-like [Dysidea avara]|uniref:WD repeat and FYVE domain-containing protein 2-like n=1 Tax=Dysidea avara TaxID=196820 RepID=UPI003334A69B